MNFNNELTVAGKPSRVSVAMCTFNGARFLSEQLDSILGQSEMPDELVVCDDGSTDDTINVLEEYSELAPFPVNIHRCQVRLGVAQNFAKCINLCSGDLVVLSDQDDIWLPDRIRETRLAFAANENLTFTYSDAILIDDGGRDMGRTIYKDMRVMHKDRQRLEGGTSILPTLLVYGGVCGCTMAFRSKFLPIILPIPETWIHDQWISLVLCAIGPSARIRPTVQYRQHSAQSIGLGRLNLKARIRHTRTRKAEEYQAEIRHFRFGLDTARSHSELHDSLVPALRSRIEFLCNRYSVRSGGIRGMRLLARLLWTGDYWRLGAGWGSLLKDVATLAGGFKDKAK